MLKNYCLLTYLEIHLVKLQTQSIDRNWLHLFGGNLHGHFLPCRPEIVYWFSLGSSSSLTLLRYMLWYLSFCHILHHQYRFVIAHHHRYAVNFICPERSPLIRVCVAEMDCFALILTFEPWLKHLIHQSLDLTGVGPLRCLSLNLFLRILAAILAVIRVRSPFLWSRNYYYILFWKILFCLLITFSI